jgi:uncharacterized protein YbjT (DUF2867 family)
MPSLPRRNDAVRILIIGSGGFIGGYLVARLAAAGHRIVCTGRNPDRLGRIFPMHEIQACDFRTDSAEDWRGRLGGVDAVVNAAGIIQNSSRNGFDAVHVRGPGALFDACAAAGIAKVVQISALGADGTAWSRFHRSKIAADDRLCRLADFGGRSGWIVLRPAVVIGRGGHSTALFAAVAALPWPLRLGPGTWRVPVIHIDDLTYAVHAVLETHEPLPAKADLVGPDRLSTDQLTEVLRAWLGLAPRAFIAAPEAVLMLSAAIGERLGLGMLSSEALCMLRQGYADEMRPLPESLGWSARPLAQALASTPATEADRWHAGLFFLKPALRIGLALLWIVTALLSAFFQPIAKSEAMVLGLGLTGWGGLVTIFGGAALDAVLGFALLACRRPVLVGAAQIATMAIYLMLATIAVPAAWGDPLGPLTKTLVVVLATLVMIVLEVRR